MTFRKFMILAVILTVPLQSFCGSKKKSYDIAELREKLKGKSLKEVISQLGKPNVKDKSWRIRMYYRGPCIAKEGEKWEKGGLGRTKYMKGNKWNTLYIYIDDSKKPSEVKDIKAQYISGKEWKAYIKRLESHDKSYIIKK